MDIIVGTAGHIDHGKTALVKALTGIDADRLPEEKLRGITIDIGFAELTLDDLRIGFVDVPGHERFVKNMLAGASGIDLVMLVIAADEGVMPQTREHFDICRLLDTKAGVIVLTKTDLVDDETLEFARIEASELVKGSFLESAEIIGVSSRTGSGFEELKKALIDSAKRVPARKNDLVTRVPIDRSFSVKGHGTVVTGTVASGQVGESDEMDLLPTGSRVRVRGLQTHGKEVKTVTAGQRAALNLGGITTSDISRGMVLVEMDTLRPTQILDAEMEVIGDARGPLRSRQRVRLSIGTVEALARVQVLNSVGAIEPGTKDLVQLRVESPIVAVPGERFILRSYSPQTTIAGGGVLDPLAQRHRRKDIADVRRFLRNLIDVGDDDSRIRSIIKNAGDQGLASDELQARTGMRIDKLKEVLSRCIEQSSVVNAEDHYISSSSFEKLRSQVAAAVEAHHRRERLAKGIHRETLREQVFPRHSHGLFRETLKNLEREGTLVIETDTVRLASHNLALTSDEAKVRSKLEMIFTESGLDVPKLDDALTAAAAGSNLGKDKTRQVFQLLLNQGMILKINDEFYFPRNAVDELKQRLRAFADASVDRLIDVPKFKEIAGISRKYAIPLLEYFDREKVTLRAGDKRLIL